MKIVTKIWDLLDTATYATEYFNTFSEGMPELVPLGIGPVDAKVGGLGPGAAAIVGAQGGCGKSSVALSAMLVNMENGVKTGYISLEDTPDVVGSRLLARYAEVNSQKIRTKSFSPEEAKKLEAGQVALEASAALPFAPEIVYAVGGRIEAVLAAIKELAERGCKIVWVDYIQKIRGHDSDRRNEVSRSFTFMQAAASEAGVALVVTSQISRQMDPDKMPRRWHLKESGDLENEARLIIMLAKNDVGVRGLLDKSTFGGEGTPIQWERRECGTLFEVDYQEDF